MARFKGELEKLKDIGIVVDDEDFSYPISCIALSGKPSGLLRKTKRRKE
jgi:hypothetical protein